MIIGLMTEVRVADQNRTHVRVHTTDLKFSVRHLLNNCARHHSKLRFRSIRAIKPVCYAAAILFRILGSAMR